MGRVVVIGRAFVLVVAAASAVAAFSIAGRASAESKTRTLITTSVSVEQVDPRSATLRPLVSFPFDDVAYGLKLVDVAPDSFVIRRSTLETTFIERIDDRSRSHVLARFPNLPRPTTLFVAYPFIVVGVQGESQKYVVRRLDDSAQSSISTEPLFGAILFRGTLHLWSHRSVYKFDRGKVARLVHDVDVERLHAVDDALWLSSTPRGNGSKTTHLIRVAPTRREQAVAGFVTAMVSIGSHLVLGIEHECSPGGSELVEYDDSFSVVSRLTNAQIDDPSVMTVVGGHIILGNDRCLDRPAPNVMSVKVTPLRINAVSDKAIGAPFSLMTK